MHRAVCICALVLLIFSPIQCKKTKEDDQKKTTSTSTVPASKVDQDIRSEIDLMSIMKECNESFRIQMSYLEQLNNSGSFPDETERTPKCYIRCVLETSGVASGDGEFNPTVTVSLLTQVRAGFDTDTLLNTATDCMDRQETCKCERSYQYIKCIMEKEIEEMENV